MAEVYPEVVSSWKNDLSILITYLHFPNGLQPMMNTSNTLEQFMKEVKRCMQVIEPFPQQKAITKTLFLERSR